MNRRVHRHGSVPPFAMPMSAKTTTSPSRAAAVRSFMTAGYLLLEAEPTPELLADLLSAMEAGRRQTKLDPVRAAGYFRRT